MRDATTIVEQGVLRGVALLRQCVCLYLLLLTEQRLHKMQYLMCDFFYSQDVTKPSRSNG
jgi:hypothetical protein